eukprot:s2235_g2.t1
MPNSVRRAPCYLVATFFRIVLVKSKVGKLKTSVAELALCVAIHIALVSIPFLLIDRRPAPIQLPHTLKQEVESHVVENTPQKELKSHGTVDPMELRSTPLLEMDRHEEAQGGSMLQSFERIAMLLVSPPQRSWPNWAYETFCNLGLWVPARDSSGQKLVGKDEIVMRFVCLRKHTPGRLDRSSFFGRLDGSSFIGRLEDLIDEAVVVGLGLLPLVIVGIFILRQDHSNWPTLIALYCAVITGSTNLRTAIFSSVARWRTRLCMHSDYMKFLKKQNPKEANEDGIAAPRRVVAIFGKKQALMLPKDKPRMVGSFVATGGQLWPVLQRLPDVSGYVVAGALRVGRIQSISRKGVVLDVAENFFAFVLNRDLKEPRSSYFCGRAMVLRIFGVKHQLICARQLHPVELLSHHAGAKEVPDKDKVSKEHLLPLPRLGSVVLGRPLGEAEVLLQHPPCRAMLKGTQTEDSTVYRVCDVTCDAFGFALPVVVKAEEWTALQTPNLPKVGKEFIGTVKGYAEQQPLPDGSLSDGLVVFCSPGGVIGYCPVPSAAEAQKSLALGTQLGSVTVRDYVAVNATSMVLLDKYLGSVHLQVGAFYEGQLEEQEGSMWRMKVGSRRAVVTAAKLRGPKVAQKLWVRILAADLKSPRLAFARVLNWEERQKDTKELQQQVELQSPMPRVGQLVRGRWLGPSFRAVNEQTKVDPRRLKAVAQRVEDDDIMVELEEIPCLGIIKSSSIIVCKEMDPCKLEGHVTAFPTTNILGIGLSAFAELRMPTIGLERLKKGDRLEGKLDRLLSDKRQANLGDEWTIHLNCENRRQAVEGRWRLETRADLRLNKVLRKGSNICNLKVLSIDPTQNRVQLSPTEGEVAQLQNDDVLQGIVGKIFEYGIFFEVGCRKRVLCRSCHLLRPVDEYSEGQVVRRLFVFQTSAMTLPQLCEGGAPSKLTPFEKGAMEAFGLEEEVSVLGWVVCTLPYGLVIELQDVERDAFCKETNLLKALQVHQVSLNLGYHLVI